MVKKKHCSLQQWRNGSNKEAEQRRQILDRLGSIGSRKRLGKEGNE
jgi:hypothetical protein